MSPLDLTKVIDYLDFINKSINTVLFIYNVETRQLELMIGAVEKVLGKNREELQNNHLETINAVHQEDREILFQTFLSAVEDEKMKSLEFRVNVRDREKWFCLTVIPLSNVGGEKLVAGNIEDITKVRNYTFNLNKFNSKKDATLNILSHDLAGPFNNIQQLATIIRGKIKKYNDPEVEKWLSLIAESSKKGTDLIEDFVAQEFMESSEVDVVKRRIDLVKKIKIIEEDYKNSEQMIHKVFHFSYSSPEIFVHLDDMKFMQVINNILSNAIKFTPDGATIATKVEERENTILISVEDNGVGIPKQLQPLVFEKFTKARRPGLKGEKTTGLGMSLAKLIVEWHNGKIWFESEENKGTTFFVEIPKE